MPEIQKADPAARARAIGLLAAGFAIGAVVIGAFSRQERAIQDWLYRHLDYLVSHPAPVIAAGLLLVAPLLLSALYVYRFGHRAVRAARMPPPGVAVVRDTPVLTGARAVRRGRLIQATALLLGLAAAAGPVVAWYLFMGIINAG